MKYSPRRNYLHPVLRPFSDDYPSGELQTELQADVNEQAVNVVLTFEITEPSILERIERGDAVCAAMLYCGWTLHREMFCAGTGSLRAETSISTDHLRGTVDVHPSIITVNNLSYPTSTVHQEYGSDPIPIAQWNPLATDRPWQFQVNPSARPAKGIFNRVVDDGLSDGEFDVVCDITEKYVNVTANSKTMTQLKEVSADDRRTLPTVFLSALVSALAEIKEIDAEAPIHDDGWVTCIRNNLKRVGADIGDQEQSGSHTLFRAAQMLLSLPFGPYLSLAIQERASEGQED